MKRYKLTFWGTQWNLFDQATSLIVGTFRGSKTKVLEAVDARLGGTRASLTIHCRNGTFDRIKEYPVPCLPVPCDHASAGDGEVDDHPAANMMAAGELAKD